MNENIDHSGDLSIWLATKGDLPFIHYLCSRFRNREFFYVPDSSIDAAVERRQIIAFSFRALEAGYIWVTFPPNGRSRINQLAVEEDLWRNKVGTSVVNFVESEVASRGGWSIYLSCNSTTPGHSFWPEVGYSPIVEKPAGRRGGNNYIWAKVLGCSRLLFPVAVNDVKSERSYRFQSSISISSSRRLLLRESSKFQLNLNLLQEGIRK